MDDATRPRDGSPDELGSARESLSELVGELTHAVLMLFRIRGLPLAERFTLAGGDPFDVIDVFAITLRALADGLEAPDSEWITG